MLKDKKVCFLGAGAITEAMLGGLIKKGIIASKNITIVNKSNYEQLNSLVKKYDVNSSFNKKEAIKEADVIVLAVKPKDVTTSLDEYKEVITKQLILSVVAGVDTDYLNFLLGNDLPVIRSMPNTSAMIGMSITAVAKGRFATDQDLEIIMPLLEAIGKVVVVEERLLDAVTGLSGSGPAYFYYIVEAMEKVAIELGFDDHIARELIIHTLIGAGHMLLETKESAKILREKVTSPNGTTFAGLKVLEDYYVKEGVIKAIKRATERSKELGSTYKREMLKKPI